MRGARGKVEGDQAVVARETIDDEDAVLPDAPGRVVAEVQDKLRRVAEVEVEVSEWWTGWVVDVGDLAVREQADGRVAGLQGIVVGGDGGVLIGGFGSGAGVKEGELRLRRLVIVADLAEGSIGAEGEGRGENEGGDENEWGAKVYGPQGESEGQGESGHEDGEEAPGELEEGELGSVLPDGESKWREKEGDDAGEDCEQA